jgi:hypothetical protein
MWEAIIANNSRNGLLDTGSLDLEGGCGTPPERYKF